MGLSEKASPHSPMSKPSPVEGRSASNSPSGEIRGKPSEQLLNGVHEGDSSRMEEVPTSNKSVDTGSLLGSKANVDGVPPSNGTQSSVRLGSKNDTIRSRITPSSSGEHEAMPQNTTKSSSEDVPSSTVLPLEKKVDFASHTDQDQSPTISSPPPSPDGKQCDLSIGKWVEDDSYPLYRPGTCPFVDEAFSCQSNGRPDSKYDRWRWVPRDCNIPRFNGTHMLERLKGKRLVFVGDSLNRNQWESMLCMLWESLPDKRRIVQINGGRISKLPGAYVFKFMDYDFKVEFYTSPYLVDKEDGDNPTDFRVRLDRLDKSERRWRKASILVFNTGHWWTTDKIGEGENRFQEGLKVYEKMNVSVAYSKALMTWAKWVATYVTPQNTSVFFRGYSPVHYIGGQWNSGGQCHDETEPIFNESFLTPYPRKMQVLEEILQEMKLPVQVLNITRLSDFRKDAHPATYGHARDHVVQYQDCSHWCLPGLPDTWNELLYSALISQSVSVSS